MNKFMARHGDWLIESTNEAIPDGATKEPRDARGRAIIGEGEATGHAHAVAEQAADIYTLNGMRWLVAQDTVTIQHEEHATITLAPGVYVLRGQQEFNHASGLIERVRD